MSEISEALNLSVSAVSRRLEKARRQLRAQLANITLGDPDSSRGKLAPILKNKVIFGSDLTQTPLAARIEEYFRSELESPGAVRRTLSRCIPE